MNYLFESKIVENGSDALSNTMDTYYHNGHNGNALAYDARGPSILCTDTSQNLSPSSTSQYSVHYEENDFVSISESGVQSVNRLRGKVKKTKSNEPNIHRNATNNMGKQNNTYCL